MNGGQDRAQVSELVQGDLAVNLFMVFLSILATLTITVTVLATEGFKVDMESEDMDEASLGMSRGWAPVQHIRPRLLIRNGSVTYVDFTRVGVAFIDPDAFQPEIPGYNESRLYADDPDPGAFLVKLGIGDDPLPEELVVWSVPADTFRADSDQEIPPDLAQFFETNQAIDLMVYADAETDSWHLASYLYENKIRTRFYFWRSKVIGFRRLTDDYTFEKVYK